MNTQQIERWVNELARPLPASFMALDLKAKLVGIATFAHIAGDVKVRQQAMEILATF